MAKKPAVPSSQGPTTARVIAPPALPPSPLLPKSWLTAGQQVWILVMMAILFYGSSIINDFAVDDKIVYHENMYVKEGISGIPSLLKYDTFQGYFKKDKQLLEGGRYRPLSLITFAIEYQIWGLNPHLSHAINVLLYALTLVALLYLCRRYLFRNHPELAFLAVLLFAIHPIHVECVTNIKGRDELLGFLFIIGVMIGAFGMVLENGKKAMGFTFVIVGFLLSVLAKENALTYLAIVPLMLYCFTEAKLKRILIPTALLIVMAGGYIAFRMETTGLVTQTKNTIPMNDPYMLANGTQKIATIVQIFNQYIRMLLFPHPQAWDYGYNQFPYKGFGDKAVLFSLLVNGALFVIAVLGLKKKKPYAFGILFYFIALSIICNLLVNIGVFMADRFLYQPSFGFAIALSSLALWYYYDSNWGKAESRKRILAGVFGLVFALSLFKTWHRSWQWGNEDRLFKADVASVPQSANANKSCGSAYYREFQAAKDPEVQYAKLDSAINYYRRALAIYDKFGDASDNILVAYSAMNPIEEKRDTFFAKALAVNPGQVIYHYNPTEAEKKFKEAKQYPHDLEYAKELFHQGLYFNPGEDKIWYFLGAEVYAKQFNYTNAARCFQRCVTFQPNNGDYWHDFGVMLYNNKQYKDALVAFERTVALNPNHPSVRNSIAETQSRLKEKP
jgi:protein O-mannosyl-transferase